MISDIDRRTFIKAGATIALVSRSPIAHCVPPAPAFGGARQHDFVVVDGRIPASRRYATRAQANGYRPLIFREDAGELWLDFPRQPTSLTGITRGSDFFLLRQFAWNWNLTVRYAETHHIRNQWVSWLIS